MLKEVAGQGLEWESYEAIVWLPSSSSKRVYHMTSEIQGRKGQPGSKVLAFPVLPLARYLEAFWPIIPTLLMSV